MPCQAEERACDYFLQHLGVAFEALIAPIAGAQPCGENLRNNGVYRAIQEARRQDDATLPLGPWAHELKRAQWSQVEALAVGALASKSKDLQLAAWLLEARIHRDGFAGLGPCIALLQALCEGHWDALYPRAVDADLEYRTNVFHWMNDKLLPALRLAPLTAILRDERALTWADWEQAQRSEQRRAANGDHETREGVNLLAFAAAMAGTPTEWYRARYAELDEALAGLARLTATLNRLCGAAAPSLGQLSGLIEQIQTLLVSELHKRGVLVEAESAAAQEPDRLGAAGGLPSVATAIPDRAAAYAALAHLADYLQHLEPHSPVPYLLKRAVEWGNCNTAELYREMFIKGGGRLDIFELLGLSVAKPGEDA